MDRRSAFRAVAVALLLATLLFSGAQFARSAVRSMTAPLAGLEKLAQRPPAPEPAEPALPSSEDLGFVLPDDGVIADEPGAGTPPPNGARGRPAAKTPAQGAEIAQLLTEALTVREGLRFEIELSSSDMVLLSKYIGGGSDLTLENLPKMTKDLALTDLQRERIERWLTWKKDALAALGADNPNAIREIEDATAEAVKAELDFFQGELYDKSRQQPTVQTLGIRLAAADALNPVLQATQAPQTRTRWALKMLSEAGK